MIHQARLHGGASGYQKRVQNHSSEPFFCIRRESVLAALQNVFCNEAF